MANHNSILAWERLVVPVVLRGDRKGSSSSCLQQGLNFELKLSEERSLSSRIHDVLVSVNMLVSNDNGEASLGAVWE
jgi:hypothetical protein